MTSVLASGLLGTLLFAQIASTSQAAVAFDVASIKLNTSGDSRSGTHTLPGGRVTITNQRLRDVIRTAYGSDDIDVIGGPSWVDADRWDIIAAAPPGGDPAAPWQTMLRSLLTERFRLRAHVEPREQAVFTLVLARKDKRLGMDIHVSACKDDGLDCSHSTATTNGIKSGTLTGTGRAMSDLAVSLSRYAERRVFDKTGLNGRYDFRLAWSEEVSIFTALEEQLGLRLQSAKGPVDVVIIDSVERAISD
jgi:uncharacterized protein (TIGR03435 family)